MANTNKPQQPPAPPTPPAEPTTVELQPGQTVVDQATLTRILEQQAAMEKQLADEAAKRAGLEEMVAAQQGADTTGEKKLREKKTFEPAFRTVRLRKYPKNGDHTNLGYVVKWSNARQTVDRSGVAPRIVDVVDIEFLDGATETVSLLDLLNRGEQIDCKIVDRKENLRKIETGEEIRVSTFDPKHGLVSTGEVIDGLVTKIDVTYTIQIPGLPDPVEIDAQYVNG